MKQSALLRTSTLVGSLAVFAGDARPQTHFADVSEEMGVLFAHDDGAYTYGMGAGVAWFDADGDGDDDLLVTSSAGNHRLYQSEGGTMVDVTEGSHLTDGGLTDNMGVIAGDYDNDGLVDLYLTNNGPNQLFRNTGGMVFHDVAFELGVAGDSWTTSAAWADFDRDGDLDLYAGNYIQQLNFPYHYGSPNQLYVNVGTATDPQFVDMAPQLGVDDSGVFGPSVPGFPYIAPEGQPTAGCCLSVNTLDYDEDGDADLMVGNDFGLWVMPNRLFRNDTPPGGELVFTDLSAESGFNQGEEYNMGINAADYDHDGDWDFYKSNLGENLLLAAMGDQFLDVTHEAGPVEGYNDAGDLFLTSWGTIWGDFDNDGVEDLFVVNGYIPAASFIANDERSPNHLWMNQGDGTFLRVDPELSGLSDEGAGRGVGMCDLDADGFLDLYLMNNGAPGIGYPEDRSRFFVNQGTLGAEGNHWIELRLRAVFGNWEAIGARVELTAGRLELKRQVLGDPVYISSGSRLIHFGLGTASEVGSLRFHWPSGRTSQWLGVTPDRQYEVVEPLVTIASVGEASYAAGTLTLGFELENAGDATEDVVGRVELFGAAHGQHLYTASYSASVAAGATETVEVEIPLSKQRYAQFRGKTLEQRVHARSGDALDARAAELELPQ